MVRVNESTEELGYRFDADANFIYVSNKFTEFGFDREGAQRFVTQFVEWLAETAKLPQPESNLCSLCLRIKDMMQKHEPFSVDQRIEFTRHLREDHKIREYAPET